MAILYRKTIALSWLTAAALLLQGCTSQPAQPGVSAGVDVELAQQAWDLRQNGDYAGAAKEFLRIAKRLGDPQGHIYRLYAVETYLLGNEAEPAREALAEFPREAASMDLQAWSLILAGRLSLLDGNPEVALEMLDAATALDEASGRARDIHELRAQALLQTGRPLDAIDERMRTEPLLADQSEIDSNREAIWEIARSVPSETFEALSSAGSENARGWLELARIANEHAAGSPALAAAFNRWKLGHPHHPGEAFFAARYPESATVAAIPATPKRIALLLPLEGQAASAGTAVRDGVTAAWLADTRADKPVVDIYNAGAANALEAFDRASADGAELVIGPLEKGAVDAILRRGVPAVPMIALNQYAGDISSTAHVVQFALSPDDEARGVADRARADGKLRAWIMTADDQWGERVLHAFSERWQELGGVVTNQVTYGANGHDFATPVQQLLDIEGSKRRSAELEKTLKRELVTEPYANENADFLFLAAFSLQARQIQPQLRFFGIRDLPIYSTSHVFMGDSDARRDADLNGITFGDMPAILGDETAETPRLLNPEREDKSGGYARLFAMGVDTYRMIPQAAAMRSDPRLTYQGETGALTIAADGRVHRELRWMQFVDGLPTPANGVANTH